MSKSQKSTFANNLIKARKCMGWNQSKAADMIGVSRPAYAAYEEGRSYPAILNLPTIVHVFGITNIISFIENPAFNPRDQDVEFSIAFDSPLETRYSNADPRHKHIVDLALGIGVKEKE